MLKKKKKIVPRKIYLFENIYFFHCEEQIFSHFKFNLLLQKNTHFCPLMKLQLTAIQFIV